MHYIMWLSTWFLFCFYKIFVAPTETMLHFIFMIWILVAILQVELCRNMLPSGPVLKVSRLRWICPPSHPKFTILTTFWHTNQRFLLPKFNVKLLVTWWMRTKMCIFLGKNEAQILCVGGCVTWKLKLMRSNAHK